MQTTEERNRLQARFDDDSVSPIIAVLRCLAGILLLILVAASPWLLLSPDAAWTTMVQILQTGGLDSGMLWQEQLTAAALLETDY